MRSIFKFLDYLRFYAFTSGVSLARLKFSSRRESSIDKKPSGFPREEVDRTRTKRSENASVGTSRHNSPGTVNHGGRHGAPIEMVIFGHNGSYPPRRRPGNILIVTINYLRGGNTPPHLLTGDETLARRGRDLLIELLPLHFPLPSITLPPLLGYWVNLLGSHKHLP